MVNPEQYISSDLQTCGGQKFGHPFNGFIDFRQNGGVFGHPLESIGPGQSFSSVSQFGVQWLGQFLESWALIHIGAVFIGHTSLLSSGFDFEALAGHLFCLLEHFDQVLLAGQSVNGKKHNLSIENGKEKFEFLIYY